MPASPPEVADVFRTHGLEYLEAYAATSEQRRVLRSIALCRTEALGGHKNVYSCGHEALAYNSCVMGSGSLWGVDKPGFP
jgi:hypothetical protein